MCEGVVFSPTCQADTECAGVVAISADARHSGANAAVLKAAGAHKKPVAGTGGTSLSLAAAMYGCELAGNAGGSVATTPRTKAIGIAASLAGAWNELYVPASSSVSSTPWRSVVNECIPALVCIACARNAAESLVFPSISDLLGSGKLVAPAVGALAATRRSDLGSIATLAGALLGSFCRGSSCCALVAGGFVFPLLAPQVLAACARYGLPATSSNMAVGGVVPVLLGAVCHGALAPLLVEVADFARWLIHTSLSWWLASAAVGIAINYGSRKDWYHAYFLPLIALEHERGEMSAIGALDCLCLCVIGAGACAAQLVVPRSVSSFTRPPELHNYEPQFAEQGTRLVQRQTHAADSSSGVGSQPASSDDRSTFAHGEVQLKSNPHASRGPRQATTIPPGRQDQATASLDTDAMLARRGFCINLFCGDYIEACHPFLERDPTLDWAVYLTSFLVGGLAAGCLSSAYLPLPLSIAFSNEGGRLMVAAIVAFCLPFIVGAVSGVYVYRRKLKLH